MTKKKVVFFGMMAALLIFAFSVTGCPTDASEDPASMTFVQPLIGEHNVPRQFTINEHHQFSVRFLVEMPAVGGLAIPEGTTINGRITGADASWNQSLTGFASEMSTASVELNTALVGVNAARLSVELTYARDGGDNITGVTVSFAPPSLTGDPATDAMNNGFAIQANNMMGGTFTRQ